MQPIPVRGAGAAALLATGSLVLAAASALVLAAPAGAAIKARFTVDVVAVTSTTWKEHSTTSSSCGVNAVATSDGHGAQTVRYRARRVPVLFTFVGPGSAQFRNDYGSRRHPGLKGTYALQAHGVRTDDDPACGMHHAQSTAGCGAHHGAAQFVTNWDTSTTPVRLRFNVGGEGRSVACPSDSGPITLAPVFAARRPAAGSNVLRFARFVFHSHRRRASFRAHKTWTDDRSAGDGSVDTAQHSTRWRITYHRVGR